MNTTIFSVVFTAMDYDFLCGCVWLRAHVSRGTEPALCSRSKAAPLAACCGPPAAAPTSWLQPCGTDPCCPPWLLLMGSRPMAPQGMRAAGCWDPLFGLQPVLCSPLGSPRCVPGAGPALARPCPAGTPVPSSTQLCLYAEHFPHVSQPDCGF